MGATLRATRTAGVAGAVLIAAAAVVSGVPSAPSVPSAAQADSGDLVDRLLDVVAAVPEIDPENILVSEFDTQVEFLGDHIGDHAALEAVHDDAQQLFIDGEEAKSAVGDLASAGSRAVLLIEDGYRRLADFELVVPFNTQDDLGVTVGTDEPRNLRMQAIDLIQQGQYRLEGVLVAMRDLDLTQEQQAKYADAVARAITFSVSVDPALRDLSRDPVSRQLLIQDRFGVDIAGTAASRWASYRCIPRGAADALSSAALLAAINSTLSLGAADDCPDLPDPEVLDADLIPDRVSPISDDS